MNEGMSFMLFLFATAVSQNIVLTAGFGSSMLLRITRHPKDIGVFSALLSGFAVATVAIAYPLDHFIGTGFWMKLIRPLLIVGIAVLLYCITSLVLSKGFPGFYARVSRLLPLAAFNNLVIGVALICNHSFALSIFGAIGLALGCSIGFVLLSLVTAEGIERLDNPDIPPAFRGLPVTLIYVGILALAILGFSTSVSFA